MIQGILFAILACFAWGFIFPVPMLMTQYNPIEVALGRYFFLGLISCCLVIFRGNSFVKILNRATIQKAMLLGLVGNIFYFIMVVASLRFCHPAVIALILGISPVGIAVIGSLKKQEINFKNFLVPFLCIFLGLFLVNIPSLKEAHISASYLTYFFGLVCGFIALVIWCWFAIYNSRFLKENAQVPAFDWSILIGLTTFLGVLFLLVVLSFFYDCGYYFIPSSNTIPFYLGSAVLGCISSWLGSYLWNKASFMLPISLAGLLLIFETIFGILLVYFIQSKLPSTIEIIGMVSMLGGTFLALIEFKKVKAEIA